MQAMKITTKQRKKSILTYVLFGSGAFFSDTFSVGLVGVVGLVGLFTAVETV